MIVTKFDNDFFEEWKDKDVVMHCKTEEHAKAFCETMHRHGLKWDSGRSYLDITNWESVMEDKGIGYFFNDGTYISMMLMEESLYDANNHAYENYTILEFEDFIVPDEEFCKTLRDELFCKKVGPHYFESFKGIAKAINDSIVNHPSHYNYGNIEVIDVIEDWGLNFNKGNVIKYVARSEHKNNELEDLMKAKWYIEREIERKHKHES